MRILYIHNINQIAEIFAKDLAQHGHTVNVYEPSLAGNAAPLPVKLALLPGRLLNLSSVVPRLHPNSFDIVHIHWANYGVLGWASRVPYIVHCHGSDVRERLRQPVFRAMFTNIFRRAAAVICITPDLVPLVQTIRSDAIFLPAPIDTEQFAPVQDNGPAPARPWTILLFACLDPKKGCEIAVQGIARFAQRHSGVRVQLLNWGPLAREYIERYGERFTYLPFVAQNKVPSLIHSADVIVGQFALGALGLSELKAMSCAKPVICSFRYNDAYASPAPLFQATTAKEVDEQLEYLYQNPEAGKKLGQRSREWVIENHSSKVLTARLERIYSAIVGN